MVRRAAAGARTNLPLTVWLAVAGGTATAGADYVNFAATTLTFYTLPREDFLNFARSQTAAGRRVMALASARMGHESEG